MDLEKAFDRVQWERLLDVLRVKRVDWKERRLICNLYLGQKVRKRSKGKLLYVDVYKRQLLHWTDWERFP